MLTKLTFRAAYELKLFAAPAMYASWGEVAKFSRYRQPAIRPLQASLPASTWPAAQGGFSGSADAAWQFPKRSALILVGH